MELATKLNNDPTSIHHSSISVNSGKTSSRRESKTGTAIRRASAVLGKILIAQQQSNGLQQDIEEHYRSDQDKSKIKKKKKNLSKILSGLYCKTLVILGLVLPVTEVLAENINPLIYQVYYVYLCTGSLAYMCWVYTSVVRRRAIINIINSYRKHERGTMVQSASRGTLNRYGSFYLRLGAIGFGIGSMVYSGLEFGQVLELRDTDECREWTALVSPLLRMALTIAQMQFIFLNSQHLDMCSYSVLSKFGLMHLIATNLCEWLNVIVQETKHEIEHFRAAHNYSFLDGTNRSTECRFTNVIESLVEDSAPILYPCTIEYSLICAVIIYQIWQDVGQCKATFSGKKLPAIMVQHSLIESTTGDGSSEILILDCANAHKGLLAGVMMMMLTAVSLIIFLFSSDEDNGFHGLETIETWELILLTLSLLTIIASSIKLSKAAFPNKKGAIGLDSWLLMVAQAGVSLYSMFRLTASCVTGQGHVTNNFMKFIQSMTQTLFIVHFWNYKCNKNGRPARQLITLLLLCNASLWTINTLVHNKIWSDQDLLKFYGLWGWTVVSRIAMPLNIFYRFHSTICLFEMWKTMYKPSMKFRRFIY